MGSISYLKDPGRTTDQELRAYLAGNLPTGHRVVAQATRSVYGSREWSRQLFAAVEDNAGAVSCHVLLGASEQGHIVIKALHESCGPGVHPDPPARVLAALTPTDHEYAQVFRDELADALERKTVAKALIGQVVEFDRPLGYGGGHANRTRFRLQSMTRFTLPDGPQRFRAPQGWWMRTYRVIPPADAAA